MLGRPGFDELKMWHEASHALDDMMAIWKTAGTTLTNLEVRRSMDHYSHFLSVTEFVDEAKTPKRHLFIHLIKKIPWFGNPWRYACFLDESLNKELKLACKTISQAAFEFTSLLNFREESSRFIRKRKY